MSLDPISAEELLTKASAVGQYYGFTPYAALAARVRQTAHKRSTVLESIPELKLDPIAESVAGFLKQFHHISVLPSSRQPLFIWHTNITSGRPAPKKAIVQFHALGTDRPLADVVVIRASLALVRDLFREEPVVRINSMGDRETRARYARELGNFFKRKATTLSEECAECAKRDTLEALELLMEKETVEDLPTSTDHLSDASRKRFEDLLEYLEMTETPYELARNLISRGPVWSDVCFELRVGDKRVAWGSRYTDFTRYFFRGAPIQGMGVVFQFPSAGQVVKRIPTPRLRFSFVHIGDEAKRLSIRLAEDFRKAHVALTQDIGIESLTEQMHLAERRNSPYLLIMGRKEALEGQAILRHRQTQLETILPLTNLAERLKTVV